MGNVAIAFYVVGALVTVYIVAAGWQGRDRDGRTPEAPRHRTDAVPTLDRRAAHWWRARRLSRGS